MNSRLAKWNCSGEIELAGRFIMEFAQSAPVALQRIVEAAAVLLILILSDVNMPGMSRSRTLAQGKDAPAGRSRHHDHRVWRLRD